MKTVLVTGANGFIGRHCLALLLERGYEVHAVSLKATEESSLGVHWHKVDLLESGRVSELVSKVQPTHLLHFAWYTVPGEYWTSLENVHWVQASLTLLEAFARTNGQRIVVAGSCAEYDWSYGYCIESKTPLSPDSIYGVCKRSLQAMCDVFSRKLGISFAWGRIFFLYGPYEHPERLVSSVIRSLLQDKPARCSHGKQIRDYLYVEDVAEAFVALLESNVQGPVNIASGCPVALKDIIHGIAVKLNREDLIQLGAMAPRSNDPRLLVADISRLRDEVGWRRKCGLDRGLEETITWWRTYLRL